MIELARVMAKHPTQATVVFVAYAGEEQGLYGSNHFAQMAKDQGWNIQGNLNMDIVGSSLGHNGVREPHQIRLFSEGVPTAETAAEKARRQAIGGENDGESRQLARYVKETGENDATDMEVKLIWRRDRFLRSGDQVSYLQRHWPAVRFTEPNENFDHEHQDVRVENGTQFGDLEKFVDFPYLARVTRVVGSSLAALSRSPRAPVNARMITAGLGYDTELRWNANPESDVADYEIVWRNSTAPLWTHAPRSGTSRRRRSRTSSRTTTRSACERSTRTATAARSPTRSRRPVGITARADRESSRSAARSSSARRSTFGSRSSVSNSSRS